MFERSIINICYSDNAFEATDFTGCSQTWCSAFSFVAGYLYIFRTKLQPNNMKNNMVFMPLKFQDNFSCIFVDIQQKVRSRKCPITYWQIVYKSTIDLSPWCSKCRRIDKVEISTPVEIDQRTANYLEEGVWSLTIIEGLDNRALMSPSVVHCQFFKLFIARLSFFYSRQSILRSH